MHNIIITPFSLQGNMFSNTLKRHNIQSIIFTPQSLPTDFKPSTDAIVFPHQMGTRSWQCLKLFFPSLSPKTPLIFVGKNHKENFTKNPFKKLLPRSVFIDESIEIDEIPDLIKATIQKRKQAGLKQFKIGRITLDRRNRAMIYRGKTTLLTRKEFHLLELLMLNAGTVTSRDRIIDYVWDKRNFVAQNTIDVYVSRLRKKIQKRGKALIHTIPCLGYEFRV